MSVAVNWTKEPTTPVVDAGSTSIDTGTAAVTVKVVESVSPIQVAWIVVVPAESVRANPRMPPALAMAATAVFEETHVAWLVTFWVLLSLKMAVAWNGTLVPAGTLGAMGV